MRQVTTPNFCSVCLEGLWLSLLRRVDFIDSLEMKCEQVGVSPPTFNRVLEVGLVPLGQFRQVASSSEIADSERYAITWSKDGNPLPEFADQYVVELEDDDSVLGLYAVDIQFQTPEVRRDPLGLLKTRGEIWITERCRA